MSRKILFALLPLFFPAIIFAAPPAEADIAESLRIKIRMIQHMALNPLLIKAVRQQNSEALDMETINRREQGWIAGDELSELKNSMLASNHAAVMQRFVDGNRDLSEIYLTDNQGAIVAAYPLTDDYWQGDEEEWTNAFNNGNGRVFIASLEQNKATNSILTHVSAPVLDRNKTIGVLVVGIKLGGAK